MIVKSLLCERMLCQVAHDFLVFVSILVFEHEPSNNVTAQRFHTILVRSAFSDSFTREQHGFFFASFRWLEHRRSVV